LVGLSTSSGCKVLGKDVHHDLQVTISTAVACCACQGQEGTDASRGNLGCFSPCM
jgi:hypothetical protein